MQKIYLVVVDSFLFFYCCHLPEINSTALFGVVYFAGRLPATWKTSDHKTCRCMCQEINNIFQLSSFIQLAPMIFCGFVKNDLTKNFQIFKKGHNLVENYIYLYSTGLVNRFHSPCLLELKLLFSLLNKLSIIFYFLIIF